MSRKLQYAQESLGAQVDRALQKAKRSDYKSSKTKVRPRAIAELNNASVLYHLGGTPAYIHSNQEYFRAGLKTAERVMESMLEHLVAEQKSKMLRNANRIDNMWLIKLKKTFGTTIPTFESFKTWWETAIMNGQNPSLFFARLAPLLELKEAKTRLAALKQFRDEARASIDKKGGTKQDQAKLLEEKLAPYQMTVQVSSNGKNFTYGGKGKDLEREWEATIKKATKEALLKVDGQDAHLLDILTDAKIKALSGDKNDLKATEIGDLLEYRSVGIYNNIVESIDGVLAKNIDLIVENIAAEKQGGNTKYEKADTRLSLLYDGQIVLDFAVSDKASQTVEYGLQDMTNAPIIEQFVASLDNSSLNFAHFGLESAALTKDNPLMQKLIDYVLVNKGAHNIKIEGFKDLLVLYAAWLKINSEIVGDADAGKTPLAVRTLKTLYNTADILRLFINLDTRGMFKYLNKTYLSNFYKNSFEISPTERGTLFVAKRAILQHNADVNGTDANVNYKLLYEKSELLQLLSSFQSTFKRPHLQTNFVIRLDNIIAKTKGA